MLQGAHVRVGRGRLGVQAVQFGLGPAKSGQIRWIGDNGEIAGDARTPDVAQTRAAEPAPASKAKPGHRPEKAAAKPVKPAPQAADAAIPYEN